MPPSELILVILITHPRPKLVFNAYRSPILNPFPALNILILEGHGRILPVYVTPSTVAVTIEPISISFR